MNRVIKQRNSNLELYRIIVMLAIVAHHYVVNSGLRGEAVSEYEFNSHNLFFLLFGMWGKTGINCFVLITGYFMCQSQISLRKFLKLLLQVEFYNLVISAVFLIVGYEGYTMKEFCLQLIPVKNVTTGFTPCFLLFYLTIPFLNVLVHHIDRRMHLMLIVLCQFTYTFIPYYIPNSNVSMNYVSWFIVL